MKISCQTKSPPPPFLSNTPQSPPLQLNPSLSIENIFIPTHIAKLKEANPPFLREWEELNYVTWLQPFNVKLIGDASCKVVSPFLNNISSEKSHDIWLSYEMCNIGQNKIKYVTLKLTKTRYFNKHSHDAFQNFVNCTSNC